MERWGGCSTERGRRVRPRFEKAPLLPTQSLDRSTHGGGPRTLAHGTLLPRSKVAGRPRVAMARRLREACRPGWTQCTWRVERQHAALVQQGDAGAALGFIEVRSRHQDRDARCQKLRQQLPEFATRNRINTGRGFVEQNHLRLVHQRAGQGEFLFHAAG